MAVTNAVQKNKTVADPIAEYESLKPLWNRSRAVCSGERYVKDYDGYLDTTGFTNLLIPFSPSMTPAQYAFYKAEAELPGIVSQFAKMVVGGLLRKQPTLKLPDSIPQEVSEWIMNSFGQDDASLTAFLDKALWEELQTSRAFIQVDFPNISNIENLTREELRSIRPYPILLSADTVINWRTKTTDKGTNIVDRIIVKGYEESFSSDNEFHPVLIDTLRVHEIDESGFYQIRIFQLKDEATQVPVVSGQRQITNNSKNTYELVDTISNIMFNGERLNIIPIWSLNGNINPIEPILSAIIDKEISLYNKISRRNHLLYGASTYTPVVFSDMTDERFDEIVSSGLGTWIKLEREDRAEILKTPTEALQDMDRAIASSIEEMAKMGIRMLSPETAQSGIALEIRNAAQTAQLGTLNNKISNTLSQIIAFMINWRYDLDIADADVDFSLSADFNPIPLGADWIRLATEWYEKGLIPRSIWLRILKQNDLIEPDYNDEDGIKEINADELLNQNQQVNQDYANQIMNGQ